LEAKLQAKENFQENPLISRFHKGNLNNIYTRTRLIGEFHHVIEKANLHTLEKL
jgi:hypothetical protein